MLSIFEKLSFVYKFHDKSLNLTIKMDIYVIVLKNDILPFYCNDACCLIALKLLLS